LGKYKRYFFFFLRVFFAPPGEKDAQKIQGTSLPQAQTAFGR
jgi:hypothetical protein